MKILHIGKYYPPFRGGMENFLEELAKEQVSSGHQVRVLCHWHETGYPTVTEKPYSGLKVTRTQTIGILAYAPLSPGFFRQLEKIIRSFSPDIVHVHLPNLSAFFLLMIQGIPKTILHWHSDVVPSDHDVRLKMLYPVYRIFENKLLSGAQAIIATSSAYFQTSAPLMKAKHKCRVIPLGISLAKMDEVKKHAGLSVNFKASQSQTCSMDSHLTDHGDFILAVGRFSYYKGFEYLIRACSKGYNGKVVIVGDGPLKPKLEKLKQKLFLDQRIFMPGLIPDHQLYQLLSGCTALCLPSIERTEAFGLVLLEAMYFAKPLITTHVAGSGMNEVNIHNVTGLVVEPGNSRKLAEAMNFMVHNKTLARDMGKNGRKRLENQFVISRVAKDIEEIYRN